MTMLSRADLATLPISYLSDVVQTHALDLTTEEGRSTARLQVAVALAKGLKAKTLIQACRAHGIRHVNSAHQAAHALASTAIPVEGGQR